MMTTHRFWLFSFLALSFFLPSRAAAKVGWKTNPTVLKVPAGQPLAINLSTADFVVGADATKPLLFALFHNPSNPSQIAPTWLSIDADSQTLRASSGHPAMAEAGIFRFGMSVGQGIDGGSIGEFDLMVVTVPNCGSLTQLPMTALENASFQSTDAATVCSDPGGAALTYKLHDPNSKIPTWLNLTGSLFKGMAPWNTTHSNVGMYDGFDLEIDTVSGGQLIIPATVTINRWFRPPVWTKNPVALPNGKVAEFYQQDVSSFVTNFENTPLTYSFVSGTPPDQWVGIGASTGSIGGTPQSGDDGNLNLGTQISATDPQNPATAASALTQVQFKVNPPPKPPQCDQPTIVMPDATVGVTYVQSIAAHCIDPLGASLAYVKTAGPDWATYGNSGSVLGNPAASDMGLFNYTVKVSNAVSSVNLTVTIRVVDVPAPFWVQDPINLGQTLVGQQIQFDLSPLVKNVVGTLTFRKESGPIWLSVNPNGALFGLPVATDVGPFPASFSVSNGGPFLAVNAFGTVVAAPSPVIVMNPIEFTIDAGKSLSENLNAPKYVTSPDGSALHFSTETSDAWMSVSLVGMLTASPQISDVGDHTYILVVKNANGGSAIASLIIHVLHKETPPVVEVIGVDDVVPWAIAEAENLWVVDSAGSCGHHNDLSNWFESEMASYYDAMNAAQIHHTGIYISSNPVRVGLFKKKLTGKPVKSSDGSVLLSWNEGSGIVNDFRSRIDGMWTCRRCNSPIWAQALFYNLMPGLTEYQHGYFMPAVPTDTLVITTHADEFKDYTAHTSLSAKTATDLANGFAALNAAAQKPFRINAIVSKCIGTNPDTTRDDDGSMLGSADAGPYQELTRATSGSYWVVTKKAEMDTALSQYADQVKFRALVVSKKEIPLSHVPVDPTKIEVRIAGNLLDADKWAYNAAKNTVSIFWAKLDLSTIKPGDKIEIKYTSAAALAAARRTESKTKVQ